MADQTLHALAEECSAHALAWDQADDPDGHAAAWDALHTLLTAAGAWVEHLAKVRPDLAPAEADDIVTAVRRLATHLTMPDPTQVAEEIARDIESVETAHDWGRGDGLSQAATRWRHTECGHVQAFDPSRDPRTPGSGPQAGCRCDGCGYPTSLYEWEHVDRGAACPATWVDDWGKDHACDKGADHTGGHECGCGARVPAYLLSVATRLARAVVAHLNRPLGVNEALRTLAMDALRAGLIDAETAEGSDPPTSGE